MMGMPVVSTHHNGIPEHGMDGVSGFLVREHDFESMAERMVRLIEDPELRMEMGQRGRENISAMCDPERRRQALLELIKTKTASHG